MCGRFTLSATGDVVAEMFHLTDPPDLAARYNIAPSQEVAALRATPERPEPHIGMLRWGLIPFWAKDPAIGSRMINARSETAAEKPSFRAAFRRRRCLVIADGFYEWKKEGKRKQPYCIRMTDGSPFAFAGLWEHWEQPDGRAIESCTLLTTSPNELLRPIHDRMPVILDSRDYAAWLDPEEQKPNALAPLLVPYPPDAMTAFPVSTRVNSPSHDAADLVNPLDPREP